MKNHPLFLGVVAALMFFDVFAADVYPMGIKIEGPSFIEYRGASRSHGRWMYRFENRGPEKVYITVCLQEGLNKRKQYKSNARVPVYGSYNVTSFDTSVQGTIVVAASPYEQPVIAECGESV